jgi:hypothetical protein
MGVPL